MPQSTVKIKNPQYIDTEPKPVDNSESVRLANFVQEQFPKGPTENRADYWPVGGKCFRINFWSERENKKHLYKENCITRSLHVQITQDEGGRFKIGKVFEN